MATHAGAGGTATELLGDLEKVLLKDVEGHGDGFAFDMDLSADDAGRDVAEIK